MVRDDGTLRCIRPSRRCLAEIDRTALAGRTRSARCAGTARKQGRSSMRPIRRGQRGPAVAEIRGILVSLGTLASPAAAGADSPGANPAGANPAGLADEFDTATEIAVRAFQQSRGLSVDGEVGDET